MKGYVEATKGVRVSKRRLKQVLPVVAPIWHYARQTSSLERSNPAVYSARYFGHKLHLDQNEKFIHFGVTYVMARDGFSGKDFENLLGKTEIHVSVGHFSLSEWILKFYHECIEISCPLWLNL